MKKPLFMIGCILLGMAGGFFIRSLQCATQAKDVHFNYQYRPIKGCLIETAPGTFMAMRNYKEQKKP